MNLETRLAQWLNDELTRRGWSIRQAAERGGVSPTAINNVLLGNPVRLGTYKALSKAFETPLMEILELAGEIPPRPEPVHNEDELLRYWRRLDVRERLILLAQIRGLAEAEKSFSRRESPAGNPVGAHPACLQFILELLRQKQVVTREDVQIAIRQVGDLDIAREFADILDAVWQERKGERQEEERAHCK